MGTPIAAIIIADAELAERLIAYHDLTLGDVGRHNASLCAPGFSALIASARSGKCRGLGKRIISHYDGLIDGHKGYVDLAMSGYVVLVNMARGESVLQA